MTAITYDGAVPTVGADADTWGSELNTGALAKIKVDLDMLNTTTANTILGRNEGTTGEVERLSVAETTAMLNAVVGDSGSGGTKGLVPAPAAGDGAARKVLSAAGTWIGNEIKAQGLFTGATGATVSARNISCVRSSESIFVFTFGTALADANYGLQIMPIDSPGTAAYAPSVYSKTASGFSVQTTKNFGGTQGGYDPAQISVLVTAA